MVSIIPGMLSAAPDRTDTSKGRRVPPKRHPLPLEHLHALDDLAPQRVMDGAIACVVFAARVGGGHDRGRHRQPERPHTVDAPRLAADLLARQRARAVYGHDLRRPGSFTVS
jgi:hypothetical protein